MGGNNLSICCKEMWPFTMSTLGKAKGKAPEINLGKIFTRRLSYHRSACVALCTYLKLG